MAPKKGLTGTAAVAKDVKEKKAVAAPGHASYKGELLSPNRMNQFKDGFVMIVNHLLTLLLRYDQGSYPQCESIRYAPDHVVDRPWARCRCRKLRHFPTELDFVTQL